MRKYDNVRVRTGVLLLFFCLVTLSRYNLQIGFSLKPYMIFLVLVLLLKLHSLKLGRMHAHEQALLLFYLCYSASGAFSFYTEASLRIVLGIVLVWLCYFIMRAFLRTYSQRMIETAISGAGIVFNAASLILYVLGLQRMHVEFDGGEEIVYGAMADRGYPRLIGLLDDPNMYVFYNTLFLLYFLCNSGSMKNKWGLALALTTSILTFSRGGLAALLAVFLIYILMNKPIKQLKLIFTAGTLLLIAGYAATVWLKLDLPGLMGQRLEDFSQDGGSGRLVLWERSLGYFTAHPFIGVGAFNVSEYNLFLHGEKLYAHNTFLEILAEAGAFVFMLYLLFLALTGRKLLRAGLHRRAPYVPLTFAAFLLQMVSLSLVINEMLFVYLAILCSYLTAGNMEEEQYGKNDDAG